MLICLILLGAGSLMGQKTLADLTATMTPNTGIKWYTLVANGTQYTGTETLVNGTTYYASQTVNGFESTARFAVTVTVNAIPTPTFTAEPGTIGNTATDVTYTTQSGKSSYVWTFPGTVTTDYTLTSGGTSTDYTVTLKYVTAGSKTVTINYTDNGCTAASATSSTATTVSAPLAVGDAYEGGKVAYIFVTGDPGYVAGQTHGIIAAVSDIESSYWGCLNVVISGADGTAIGTGNQNTLDIVAGCATEGIAAALCNDLVVGVYSDWYLPSKDELYKLYLNRSTIGGFSNALYWTSSEESGYNAYTYNFGNGSITGKAKVDTPNLSRAIRAF